MTEPGNLPLDEKRAGLPQVFTPARAAEALRAAGLQEMTECALRTRAYRRQIPFHLNGRRIFFTMEDLREISQGVAYKPEVDKYPEQGPPHKHDVPTLRQTATRRKAPQVNDAVDGQWRARRPRGGQLDGIPSKSDTECSTRGNARWGASTACALSVKDLAGASRQPSMRYLSMLEIQRQRLSSRSSSRVASQAAKSLRRMRISPLGSLRQRGARSSSRQR
jgi:hypothetical protein